MVNYNPYINWVGFHPLYIYMYTLNNRSFFIARMVVVLGPWFGSGLKMARIFGHKL